MVAGVFVLCALFIGVLMNITSSPRQAEGLYSHFILSDNTLPTSLYAKSWISIIMDQVEYKEQLQAGPLCHQPAIGGYHLLDALHSNALKWQCPVFL